MHCKLVLALLMLAASCASTTSAPVATAPSKDDAPADATIAPRPFTAEQIRAAMPTGQQLKFRMEVAGAPTIIEQWIVTAADATQMTMSSKSFADDGKLVEDQGSDTSTWTKLMEHATFPAAKTTVTESTVETPAGTFASIVYEVRDTKDGVPVVTHFHFAKTLPGPPVLLTVDAGGKRIRTMTLLERK